MRAVVIRKAGGISRYARRHWTMSLYCFRNCCPSSSNQMWTFRPFVLFNYRRLRCSLRQYYIITVERLVQYQWFVIAVFRHYMPHNKDRAFRNERIIESDSSMTSHIFRSSKIKISSSLCTSKNKTSLHNWFLP